MNSDSDVAKPSEPKKPIGKQSTPVEQFFTGLVGLNRWLSILLNIAAIVAISALTLDVIWGVLTRYALGEQAKWTEELARFLLIWVSLLGGAVAYRDREHLGIDFVVNNFEPSVRKGMTLLKEFLAIVIVVGVLIIGGLKLVSDALILEQTTPALGWQMGYVYLVIPMVGVLMLMFSMEFIWGLWNSKPEDFFLAEDAETG